MTATAADLAATATLDPWNPAPLNGARVSPRPIEADGIHFDEAQAEAACNFFSWYIRFSTGSKAGEPFILEPWQRWIVRQTFGWRRQDGTRLYRRVFIWVPRGNGKTELMAGFSHLALTAMSRPDEGTEVYSIAATEDQAGIVFRAATAMAGHEPALGQHYELRKRSIYCPSTHAVFRPLTAKGVGKHGLKCRVLIGDEAHEWRDGDLHTYVRDSMIKWRDPLELIISTAGKPQGYGYELWGECEKIVDRVLDDDETLVVIFQAGPDDDLADPRTWRKANPNFGVSIAEDVFAKKVRRALQLPYALADLKRYHFNVWTEDDDRWIPPAVWAACSEQPDNRDYWRELEAACAGRSCYGGLDLASTRDTCSRVLLFPPDGRFSRWIMLVRCWWPRQHAEIAKSRSRIPLERWEHDGALIVTEGNAADHQAIREQVHLDASMYKILGIGIDPWNSHQLQIDLAADGLPILVVPQKLATISPATKWFERLFLEAQLEHGNQPVARWQASSAAVRSDSNENIAPNKRTSSGKIDIIAAAVTAAAVATAERDPESYLVTAPLLVL